MENNQSTRIYFKRDTVLEREELRLNNANISQVNKDLIRQWQNYLTGNGISNQRIAKLTLQMRHFCDRLNKDLDKTTREDIGAVIAYWNRNTTLSAASKADYGKLIKQFYRWFKSRDMRLDEISPYTPPEKAIVLIADKKIAQKLYEYLEKDLKTSYKLVEIDPVQVITEHDIEQIIEKGCQTPKERAFVSMLHESGCRSGEILNIKLKDIRCEGDIIKISVDGKTGRREVNLFKSRGYLHRYIENHLDKNNQESYLWLSEDARRRGRPLMHIGAKLLLKRCFRRAGINKKCNLHWMRHSRATLLATKVTEPTLRKIMGWSKSSNMLKHYSHISDKEVTDVICELHGIMQKEKEIKPMKCSICETTNPANSEYCFRCGKALRVTTFIHDQEKINLEIERRMNEMFEARMKDPTIWAKFEEFKKKEEAKQ